MSLSLSFFVTFTPKHQGMQWHFSLTFCLCLSIPTESLSLALKTVKKTLQRQSLEYAFTQGTLSSEDVGQTWDRPRLNSPSARGWRRQTLNLQLPPQNQRLSLLKTNHTTGVKRFVSGSLGYVCMWFICIYLYVICFLEIYLLNWTRALCRSLLPSLPGTRVGSDIARWRGRTRRRCSSRTASSSWCRSFQADTG